MCSSPLETRSLPTFTRCYPRSLYLDHSHCLVLAPATLAALPSTRTIPNRDVFCVADPASSIETRSPTTLARCFPRSFAFYVAHPVRSIQVGSQQHSLSGVPLIFSLYCVTSFLS